MEKTNDFMMLFRFEPHNDYQPTEAELAEQKKQWDAWISGIAAHAKLVNINQLGYSGKQLYADMTIKDGIHISDKNTLGGNAIIKAKNFEEVIEMAKGCPILSIGGNVEIREIIPM